MRLCKYEKFCGMQTRVATLILTIPINHHWRDENRRIIDRDI